MENYGHGGHLRRLAEETGRSPEEILDFSANINPLGPPPQLRGVISRAVEQLVHYPDPDAAGLLEALACKYSVSADQIVVGNGSTEILYAIPRAIEKKRVVIPVPSYIDYKAAAEYARLPVEPFLVSEDDGFSLCWDKLGARLKGDELVLIGQPNNPTGNIFNPEEFRQFAGKHSSTLFVVDEAFADFVEDYASLTQRVPDNVIVLCSLTKFYAIPGLRLGCAVSRPENINQIRKHILPWSVNTLAQAVGREIINDAEYTTQSRRLVRDLREDLTRRLSGVDGLKVFPGRANYLLARIDRPQLDARELAKKLLAEGIAIRVCGNYEGLDGRYFRLAVRTEMENDRLVSAVSRILGRPAAPVVGRRHTPALMFQGTSSNAGKSILTAAMCRILLQDGFRVAPFKAQNMSLNSYVTKDGGEMGRAQVVQAQACRIEPDVRMNPVLLKPNSDTGSQVILRGKPVGNMNVTTYVNYKAQAVKTVRECYDSLAGEYDVVVLEGAGSPAEVNLKRHDIVNMQMAKYAGAPVLLVGDIDRGGVYASFVGTMEVMEEWERQMIAGFVVNRFRGDSSLLGPAHDFVYRHTGKQVLGVIPFLKDLGLPEEDSVEYKSGALDRQADEETVVTIAVIDLPHISNFTDFDALRLEKDVHLKIVRSVADLGSPDAVILPGSKNTVADLHYLQKVGLADGIRRLAESNTSEIVGICGGFQMIGKEVADPGRQESEREKISGLGLLDVTTVLAKEKTLLRTNAVYAAGGHKLVGYEIHHGQTSFGSSTVPVIRREDGQVLGVSDGSGRIWGTYLHGIFDADEFRRYFIDVLRCRRGIKPIGHVTTVYNIESALDRLAQSVRSQLDMKDIYKRIGL
jgi:adenosylcobyric acid synthase